MYRQCTTEKTAMQQKKFQEALLATMQEHSYQDITITDLCHQTGLSRNIFYRLFDCKDDVLYAMLDLFFYECSEHISSANSKQNLIYFFSFWKNRKDILDILDKNQLGPLLSTRGTICCCRMDFGMPKYINADWNDYQVEILSFYVSAFVGLLFSWYHTGFARSVEEMADISYALLNQPPIMIQN